ncbi:hypothetical protein GPECTOR_1g778 [Gonium pectorale]|uniref:Mitochondrial outer membrane transport complex Sam37/metaxin N-terminal domain-containing protein n=1 Tax=Gonium pectorale TaxID=33097 RepID=A0A150H485_GONPE|nr:hypothetical protein GPECTOR_1g778 [Gonium pectorale]|eukprot:KXZ56862.1 hypothetical protein GPECTOR_1g778 [Gonium pectorale]
MSGSSCILFKWPECWGLPSLSPACIQAEAYLRLAGANFAADVCSTSSSSPTGQLPALERDAYISPAEADEFASAAAVIAYAKKHIKDLDAHLSLGQRADMLAFSALIDSRLALATTLTTWCEPRGFKEHKAAAYGNNLPFPLSYLIPWSKQREVQKRFPQHTDMEQVYSGAVQVLDALADRLRATGGAFFFGNEPTSLDALLAGHLMYYRMSPAVAPVQSQPALCAYLDRLTGRYFSIPATPRSALESEAGPSWSEAAKGQKKPQQPKVEPTPAELKFRRHSYYWLLGAGSAIVAYILLSGRYIQFPAVLEQLGEDDGGDEDEDEEAGDDE